MASATAMAPTTRLALPRRLGGGTIARLGPLALFGLLPTMVTGATVLRTPPALGLVLGLCGLRVAVRLRALMVTPTMTRDARYAPLLVLRRP